MAGIRPEGLAPSFGSIVSPDIQDSFQLSWVFRPSKTTSKQTQAIVKVYLKGSNTAIITKTVSGDAESLSLSTVTYTWEEDTDYEWTVQPTDSSAGLCEISKRALFQYGTLNRPDPVIWSSGPEAYEYLGARTYFNNIKDNAILIMEDYGIDSPEEDKVSYQVTEQLFAGDVVPSRSDFLLLESVLSFISSKESALAPQVDELVEDGLGASDIHRVYEFFTSLTNRPPKPVPGVIIQTPTIPMYAMESITVVSSGKEDASVDVMYTSGDVVSNTGLVSILGASESEDAMYYDCDFRYGPSDNYYNARLFFRTSDLERIDYEFSFDLDYEILYTASTLGKAHEYFRIKTVDVRDNISDWAFKINAHGAGFKTPLGVDFYEVEYEKAAMTATVATPTAKYYDLYQGSSLKATHTLSKTQVGKYFYRVRVTDKSGLVSAWKYSIGNKFDPLKPPPPPKNFRVDGRGYDYIRTKWDASPTAEGYKVSKFWNTNVVEGGLDRVHTYTGLGEGASYNFYVKAYNRAGESEWVGLTASTLERPPVTSPAQPIKGADVWRTGYSINGGPWNPPEWRKSGAAVNQIMQGMWIELRDGYNTDGKWVRKGTTYGNHKSIVYFDRNYWKNLLAGKEILKVEMYMERSGSQHGYPNDGRWLNIWTHDYNSRPSGQPALANHTELRVNFERGDKKWFTIPNKYGEMLKAGSIGGFGFFADFRYENSPDKYTYLRFVENSTKLRVTYK